MTNAGAHYVYPRQMVAFRTDWPVGQEADDWIRTRASTPEDRIAGAISFVEHQMAQWERRFLAYDLSYYDPLEAGRKHEFGHQPVRLIRCPGEKWAVIAHWPLEPHFVGPFSDRLNTAAIQVTMDYAYRGNWVGTLWLHGFPLGSAVGQKFLKWRGIEDDWVGIFQFNSRGLDLVTERPSAREVAGALASERVPVIEVVGDLFQAVGIWDNEWREYFRCDSKARATEIFLCESM